MAKYTADDSVRSHWEEREWLLSLGDGDIVDGIRSLIEQAGERWPDDEETEADETEEDAH
jgi:hypothetical protein